ncbi:MAG: carboxypeptidase regulatory-like domain-containing protein [Acidobacteriota bacterium]
MKSNLLRLIASIIFVLTGGLTALAQGTTAPISGNVLDPNGAAISGATVIVKSIATGVEYKATTSGSGAYTVPSLGSGVYNVTIEAAGFKKAVVQDVKMDVGVPATVNVTLEVGAASESVVIQGGAELLQTQTANVSTTITGRQITELPFTSRDALDLVLLLPGTSTPGRPRSSTINGLPKGAINITLDGVNVQDNLGRSSDGFFTYIRPRIDAIDEVTVSSATPGAESSGEGAIQIKFVTRAGNNEFHGSVYEYHRNPYLNANYWFNNRDLAPLPGYNKAPRDRVLLNQYGFRVGGPISIPKVFSGKDRLFFFVNYEEYRLPEQRSRQRTILSTQAQQGIFQYNVVVNGQTQVRQANLLQLAQAAQNATTNPCAACTSIIDPTVGKLLGDIRSSTNGVGGITQLTDPNLQTFSFTNSGSQNRYFPTVRLDFNLTSKHHLENIWNYQRFGGLVDFLNSRDPQFPGFPNKGAQTSHRFSNATALRSTLKSNLVNEARFGLTGGISLFFADATADTFSGSVANQQGFALGISAAGITNAHNTTAPSRRNSPVFNFTDTVNWTRGSHNLSLGTTFTQVNLWQQSQTLVPSITFGVDTNDPANALFNAANAATNFPGASDADRTRAAAIYAVLTGRITAINADARLDEKTGKYTYLGSQIDRVRQREMGLFVQDTWRARPNLTLTGGVRWEVQQPFTALNDTYAFVEFNDLFGISGPGNLFKPGANAGRESAYSLFKSGADSYNVDYGNFAPSLGVAWTPNWKNSMLKRVFGEGGQTVLRGGYSISYSREGTNLFTSILGGNPGGSITANRSLSLGNLVTNTGTDRLPVLLRETNPNRLGQPKFPDAPVYPNFGLVTDSVNAFNPKLTMGYVQSWSFGIQREITKDTAIEVRYVANRGVKLWQQYNLNETNVIENGFYNEFKLAQANLQANVANGLANQGFRYRGPGTGTVPLPFIVAHLVGTADPNATASYASANFTSATFVNPLALQNPTPVTFANNLLANATFRNNAALANAAAGNALFGKLPANFFRVNPGKLGGAFSIENNGRTYYDAAVVELRRRMSHGLLVQGSYSFARAFTNFPVSSAIVNYQPRSLRNLNGDKTISPFGITHALKGDWIYELPIGNGKMLAGGVGPWMNRLVGGWAWNGTMRIQSGSPNDFGNVQLVGMTRNDLQKAMKIRFNDAKKIVYFLPQDIIDNTIKANSVSATTVSGYPEVGGVPQAPTGRYIAPASGKNCAETFAAQCGTNHLVIYGPKFTRFDMSVIKKIKITESVNFEFRAEFLNTFNNINFLIGSPANDVTTVGGFSTATFGQTLNAYNDISTTNDPGGRMIQFVGRINF